LSLPAAAGTPTCTGGRTTPPPRTLWCPAPCAAWRCAGRWCQSRPRCWQRSRWGPTLPAPSCPRAPAPGCLTWA
jgi:hypothetical protein